MQINTWIATLKLNIDIDIKLWDAIKMRIAGLSAMLEKKKQKITIEQLIEKE